MKQTFFYLILVIVFISCGGDDVTTKTTTITPVDEQEQLEKAVVIKKVFYTIPSPIETASIFQEAGAMFNSEILNPAENVNNYTTNKEKALNFGVYGTDLSYSNIYDQSQQSMYYMNSAKKLADQIGVTAAFNANTMERIEANINNRDSIMNLINDAYWIADSYLKENGQEHLSALIIAGGWIEGLYLGTQSFDIDNPNDKLAEKIASQGYSLANLLNILNAQNHQDLKNITTQLTELQALYNNIKGSKTAATVENNDGETTIGGGAAADYTLNDIKNISEKIETIRNAII